MTVGMTDTRRGAMWRDLIGPVMVVALALLAGCAEDDDGCPGLRDDCEIGEASCQRQIFAATACMRGQRDAKLPPIRTITRDEYAEELQGQATPEADFGTRVWGTALGLFGLVPQEQSLQESDIAQRVATIAAFYRRDTQDVTIIADTAMKPRSAILTLSHEFVHALQDQREGLPALYAEHGNTSDSNAALKCLTEGEAVVLSNLTLLHIEGTPKDEVNWQRYFGSWLESELEDVGAAEAPLLATRSLVYPVGGAGVLQVYEDAGLAGVRALYAAPAHTFRYWAADQEGDKDPEPLACAAPEAPEGFALKYFDRQGMTGLLSLYVGVGAGIMYDAAGQWRADYFAVYADPEEASDAVLVAWRMRLASELEAELLEQWVSDSERPIDVQREGAELLLSAASDPALLETWTQRGTCTPPDKSRRPASHTPRPGPQLGPEIDHARAASRLFRR